MSVEASNCISHPFRDVIDPEDDRARILYEGSFPRQELSFPGDNPVAVRSYEIRRFEDLGRFPSGGFNMREWYERNEDGTERLSHFHLEILPQLEPATHKFINDRLQASTGYDRRRKAGALNAMLPTIRICPDFALSLATKDELYFSFTADGNVIVNKDKNKALVADNSQTPPIYRFASYVEEIVDDNTEEEYRVRAMGAIYVADLKAIGDMLAIPAATGAMKTHNKRTNDIINSIARLEVSLVKKQI